MLYYNEYSNGRRYVRAYDEEKNGAPRNVGKGANIQGSPLSCLTAAKLSRLNTSEMTRRKAFLPREVWFMANYGLENIKPL